MEHEESKGYTIIKQLSNGTFGTVFLGKNKKTGEMIALKKVYKDISKKENRALLEREIKCMQSVKDKNCVELKDVEYYRTYVNLIMEYCEYDLLTFIQECSFPLPEETRMKIIYQILKGLTAIHKAGIVHRDLKPSNIMINKKGIVKIGDFGSGIFVKDKVDGKYPIEGFSRWYKAPEMILGSRSYSQDVDIWSLGCIYAELLQGIPLFKGNNEIDQISRILKLLGSPDEQNWSSFDNLPDSHKIHFSKQEGDDLEEYFLQNKKSEVEFLKTMLKYENRPRALLLLSNQYFANPKNFKVEEDPRINIPQGIDKTKQWDKIDFYKFFHDIEQ